MMQAEKFQKLTKDEMCAEYARLLERYVDMRTETDNLQRSMEAAMMDAQATRALRDTAAESLQAVTKELALSGARTDDVLGLFKHTVATMHALAVRQDAAKGETR